MSSQKIRVLMYAALGVAVSMLAACDDEPLETTRVDPLVHPSGVYEVRRVLHHADNYQVLFRGQWLGCGSTEAGCRHRIDFQLSVLEGQGNGGGH